jgi:hypothetical protein
MILNVRAISTSFAVICFFTTAIVGCLSKLSSFTCCKRATIAAILAYAVALVATRATNAVITNAMVTSEMNKPQEKQDINIASQDQKQPE